MGEEDVKNQISEGYEYLLEHTDALRGMNFTYAAGDSRGVIATWTTYPRDEYCKEVACLYAYEMKYDLVSPSGYTFGDSHCNTLYSLCAKNGLFADLSEDASSSDTGVTFKREDVRAHYVGADLSDDGFVGFLWSLCNSGGKIFDLGDFSSAVTTIYKGVNIVATSSTATPALIDYCDHACAVYRTTFSSDSSRGSLSLYSRSFKDISAYLREAGLNLRLGESDCSVIATGFVIAFCYSFGYVNAKMKVRAERLAEFSALGLPFLKSVFTRKGGSVKLVDPWAVVLPYADEYTCVPRSLTNLGIILRDGSEVVREGSISSFDCESVTHKLHAVLLRDNSPLLFKAHEYILFLYLYYAVFSTSSKRAERRPDEFIIDYGGVKNAVCFSGVESFMESSQNAVDFNFRRAWAKGVASSCALVFKARGITLLPLWKFVKGDRDFSYLHVDFYKGITPLISSAKEVEYASSIRSSVDAVCRERATHRRNNSELVEIDADANPGRRLSNGPRVRRRGSFSNHRR